MLLLQLAALWSLLWVAFPALLLPTAQAKTVVLVISWVRAVACSGEHDDGVPGQQGDLRAGSQRSYP